MSWGEKRDRKRDSWSMHETSGTAEGGPGIAEALPGCQGGEGAAGGAGGVVEAMSTFKDLQE